MQTIQAVSQGVVAAHAGISEYRDCTVRALANAADMPYVQAHSLLKKHGRKNNCGAYFPTMKDAYAEAGFVVHKVYGTTRAARYAAYNASKQAVQGTTLANLLPTLGHGEYIVNITRHALAVVNGKVIDANVNKANKRVVAVFKRVEFDVQ